MTASAEPRPHRAAAEEHARFDDVASARSGFVELAGVDVHQVVAGHGPPDLLLFHHFYGNVRTWRRLFRALEDDARMIAFDRPGFGWTERPPRSGWADRHPYRRETIADMAAELLDHHAIDRAVLVGSSAGGTAALETLRRHPDRVAAMVLLSPAVTGDVGPPGALRPLLRTAPLRALGRRIVRRVGERPIDRARVGSSWYDPGRVDDSDVAAYRGALAAPNWDVGLWDVMTSDARPNLRDAVRDTHVPTLYVAGSHDRVIHPRWSRRMAAASPNAQFVELEGCGHTPHEECAEELAGVLRTFLALLESDATTDPTTRD